MATSRRALLNISVSEQYRIVARAWLNIAQPADKWFNMFPSLTMTMARIVRAVMASWSPVTVPSCRNKEGRRSPLQNPAFRVKDAKTGIQNFKLNLPLNTYLDLRTSWRSSMATSLRMSRQTSRARHQDPSDHEDRKAHYSCCNDSRESCESSELNSTISKHAMTAAL